MRRYNDRASREKSEDPYRKTLYTLPSAGTWQLIINTQIGQWGTVYNQDQDLGRTPMKAKAMSISFENTTANSTELHVRWEKTDQYITVTTS
jgi:L,D-peptidoglycan transpeptidase YkuD (ErfK/YbiS/YcfS/YnhG family)